MSWPVASRMRRHQPLRLNRSSAALCSSLCLDGEARAESDNGEAGAERQLRGRACPPPGEEMVRERRGEAAADAVLTGGGPDGLHGTGSGSARGSEELSRAPRPSPWARARADPVASAPAHGCVGRCGGGMTGGGAAAITPTWRSPAARAHATPRPTSRDSEGGPSGARVSEEWPRGALAGTASTPCALASSSRSRSRSALALVSCLSAAPSRLASTCAGASAASAWRWRSLSFAGRRSPPHFHFCHLRPPAFDHRPRVLSCSPPSPPGLQVENQAHEQGNFAVWEKEGQDQMQKDMAQRMKGLQTDNK
jgi:hypothetical protein